MSTFVRVLASVFGAKWFFPISFLMALFVAIPLISKLDERHMAKGDAPHSLFNVVWQPGTAGAPFGYSKLGELEQEKAKAPARSYLMAQPSGRIEGGRRDAVTYTVQSSGAAEQLIEVVYSNDTYKMRSRYRATPAGVTPVFSKLDEPGQMIKALLAALGFSLLIYLAGTSLRKRAARAKADHASAQT